MYLKLPQRLVNVTLLLVTAWLLPSRAASGSESAALSTPTVWDRAALAEPAAVFREILYQECQDEGWSHEDLAKTLLLPDASMFKANQASFRDIIEHTSKRTPEEFLRLSLDLPPGSLDERNFVYTDGPITLIVMPGLSAEMASGDVFPEAVANQQSSYARHVQNAFAQASQESMVDERFSLSQLSNIAVPLSDMIRAGSIDDAYGRPIVQVINLRAVFGSLETYGKITDNYPIYKRRLDKFFRLVGNPSRIYLAGHSRGAAIALDFLARIHGDSAAKDWVGAIEGLVTFNGALYGSHYANAFFDPALQPYRDFYRHLAILQNLDEQTGVWGSIVSRYRMLRSLLPMAWSISLKPYLRAEEWSQPQPALSSIRQARIIESEIAPNVAYITNYPGFVRRVKRLVDAAIVAIDDLRHEARLAWWATHTIPPKLRYYTFTSTMASPVVERRINRWHAMLLDSPAVGRNLSEYGTLRSFYNGYYDDARVTVSDGLVGIHEGSFWPDLHQRLNSEQPAYRASALGVFGADHVAVAYANTVGTDPDKTHLFPRAKLLSAFAKYVSLEDRRNAPERLSNTSVERAPTPEVDR